MTKQTGRSFWDWLHDLGPGWPGERQWISVVVVVMILVFLQMGVDNPDLWENDVYKTLLTTFAITGFVNMILAYHFTANKDASKATQNTGEAFQAIRATANAARVADPTKVPEPDITVEPGEKVTVGGAPDMDTDTTQIGANDPWNREKDNV